jgi:hypothetical protein
VSELTQKDAELLQLFEYQLRHSCANIGVPLRYAGHKEHRDNDYYLYLVIYRFQIGMEAFELFVNTKMSHESGLRYGWNRVGLF